jgi:glycosyltransferase involved in cell wall biosynthesis
VIPTLNGVPFIRTQLGALAAQRTSVPFEVVVADNGSTDNTVAAATSYADRLDVRVVDASDIRSRSFARNVGARAARADALVFVDQDDQVAEGYVEAMMHALDKEVFVAARMEADSLNIGWVASARMLPQTVGLPDGEIPWGYGCTLGVRRDAFQRVGGFDVSIRWAAEDIDLCWRLHQAGERLTFVPDAVVNYRFPTTELALYRQGRRYGLGHAEVTAKHRNVVSSEGLRARLWFRAFVLSGRRAVTGRDRGTRANGFFLLGRRLGEAEGAVRYGSVQW